METHEYFRLKTAPFAELPDPRFFCELPPYAEALATLEYAVHAGKTCSLLLGESGSGKTLIGRILAQRLNRHARLLWIHGIGQSDDQTDLTVYQPNTFNLTPSDRQTAPTQTTLNQWLREHNTTNASSTLLIVDNADALPKHAWEDLLALATREFRATKPVSAILLGLPRLGRILARRGLVRLRRRIFRISSLRRLNRSETNTYITYRFARAGRKIQPFTDRAVDHIHNYSAGNPALINQICDNALIDAFGEDRKRIDAPHIVTAVKAIAGPTRSASALLDEIRPRSRRLRQLDGPLFATSARLRQLTTCLTMAEEDAYSPSPENHVIQQPGQTSTTTPQPDYTSDNIQNHNTANSSTTIRSLATRSREAETATQAAVDRLRLVENRISQALNRVREARAQRLSPDPPPKTVPSVEISRNAAST